MAFSPAFSTTLALLLVVAALTCGVTMAARKRSVPGACIEAAKRVNCQDRDCLFAVSPAQLPASCHAALDEPSSSSLRSLLIESCGGTGAGAAGAACASGADCLTGYCGTFNVGDASTVCASRCVGLDLAVNPGDEPCSCCAGQGDGAGSANGGLSTCSCTAGSLANFAACTDSSDCASKHCGDRDNNGNMICMENCVGNGLDVFTGDEVCSCCSQFGNDLGNGRTECAAVV